MSNDFVFDAPREFLLLNSGNEPIEIQYDAETIFFPAGDKIFEPSPSRRFNSGQNSLGEYIPGSLLLKDIAGARGGPDLDPGSDKRGEYWSASKFIKHVLKLEAGKSLESMWGVYADKGLTVLPMNPDPETVKTTRDQARKRYFKFMEKWASDTLYYYEAKANKAKTKGLDTGRPGEDFYVARKMLKDIDATREASVGDSDDNPSENEMLALARSLAEEAATKALDGNPDADLQALVSKLMDSKKFQNMVKETHDIKRRAKTRSESPFGGA